MRSIRIDDYPDGNPGYDKAANRETLGDALEIFESFGVPYILGVTPAWLDQTDFDFLNAHVKTGTIAMHGFTHLLDFKPWDRIVDTWPLGGEFMHQHAITIGKQFMYWNSMMRSRLEKYDPRHFIPPFNCYTQNLLDALSELHVTAIHTCDKEWDAYGYENLNHHNIKPIISKFQITYDYAHKVIHHLDDESQITLHWIFDRGHQGWEDCYRDLCREIVRRDSLKPKTKDKP